MNKQKSQNLLFKVDPLSTILNNKLNTQDEKLETAKLRIFESNISSLPSVKAAIYGFFLVFRRLKNSAQVIHFVLQCTLVGRHVFKENLKL